LQWERAGTVESLPGSRLLRQLFALLVLAALVAGGVYYWQAQRTGRPASSLSEVGDRLKDAAVTGAVKTALELHRGLAPLPLQISTEDGIVTLRGDVPDEALREEAERIAGSVPDVRQVVNHLQLAPATQAPSARGRSIGESLDDHALEAKVRLAFSLNRDLEGTAIDVDVYRREVRLSGYVDTNPQKELAVRIAREVPGVQVVADSVRVAGRSPAEATAQGGPRQAVMAALRGNANLAGHAIDVVEEGGRIVLRGRVRTGAERDLAGLLARQAAGGSPVENLLKIEP